MFSRKKTPPVQCLVWTGPRMADIQDCEKMLFVGSVTLYGSGYENNGASASRCFTITEPKDSKPREILIDDCMYNALKGYIAIVDRQSEMTYDGKVGAEDKGKSSDGAPSTNGGNKEGEGKLVESPAGKAVPSKDGMEKTEEGPLSFEQFNACFWESDMYYGRLRINHNMEDVLSDLFIFTEQLKLLAFERTAKSEGKEFGRDFRIRFMAYNPNFAIKYGNEECVEILHRLLEAWWGYISSENPDESVLKKAVHDEFEAHCRHKEFLEGGDDRYRVAELKRVHAAVRTLLGKDRYGLDDLRGLARLVGERTLCLNTNEELMKELDDKACFREMCKKLGVPTTESITVMASEEEASVAALKRRLGGDKYVIQRKSSSGGFGTYLFKDPAAAKGVRNSKKVDELVKAEDALIAAAMGVAGKDGSEVYGAGKDGSKTPDIFVLSRYRDPNIPLNVHAVIGPDEILLSPYSVQVITNLDRKLIYTGADYIAFSKLAKQMPSLVSNLDTYVTWLCNYVQGRGYRGVIGFDILLSGNKIEFVEANNRFQASTVILNRALNERKFLKDDQGRVKIRMDSDVALENTNQANKAGDAGKGENYKRIVIQDRKPSVQMLNLFAFEGGTGDGSAQDIAQSVYRVCYPNWKWRDIHNSRDGGGTRFPMTSPDFHTTDVPFSCYIYYNGGGTDGSQVLKADHARNMIGCVRESRTEDLHRMNNEIISSRLEMYLKMNELVTGSVARQVRAGEKVRENPSEKSGSSRRRAKPLPEGLLQDADLMKLFNGSFEDLNGSGMDKLAEEKMEEPEVSQDLDGSGMDKLVEATVVVPSPKDVEDEAQMKEFIRGSGVEKGLISIIETCDVKSDRHSSLHVSVESILEVMSRNPKACVAGGVFKDLNRYCVSVMNINRSCEFLLNRLQSRDERFDEQYETFTGAKPDAENTGLWNVYTIKCGYLARVYVLLMDCFSNRIAQAMKIWDEADHGYYPQYTDGVLWQRFYETAMEMSPVRDYRCSMFDKVGKEYNTAVFSGGWRDGTSFRAVPDSYLFKVLFRDNIVSCIHGNVVIHPNLPPFSEDWCEKLKGDVDVLALKIGLINNGVRMTGAPYGLRSGVNSSVDLTLDLSVFEQFRNGFVYNGRSYTDLPINCACGNGISKYSPFRLDYDEDSGRFTLNLYDGVIAWGGKVIQLTPHFRCDGLEKNFGTEGGFRLTPCVGMDSEVPVIKGDTRRTGKDIPFSEIGFIATDRIRLQHNCACDFVKRGIGCKFCELTMPGRRSFTFDMSDIRNVIEGAFDGHKSYIYDYLEEGTVSTHPQEDRYFDHVLIGGGTMLDADGMVERIIDMCDEVRARSPHMPIYLMSIPPSHENMRKFKDAGVTEVAFNLELFDRVRAAEFMPGKSRIPLAEYVSALRYATGLWSKPGAVRSALIIGLEPLESTLEGVRVISSLGASPILSIFRPVAGTELGHVMPYPSDELYRFYLDAAGIMDKSGVSAGPTCLFCQNNVVALPGDLMSRNDDARRERR